jgi:hypothetical protein
MMKGWIFAMLAMLGFNGFAVLILLDKGCTLEQISAVAAMALGISLALGVVGLLSIMTHGD